MSSSNLKFNPNILKRPLYRGGQSVAAARDKSKTTKIYKMNSNENMMGPSPTVVQVIQEQASALGDYPEMSDEALRVALATCYGRNLTPEHFVTGNGGMDMLDMVARGFLSPGDEIVVCRPTYGVYMMFAMLQGVEAINVSLGADDFSHDLPGILAAVNDRTRLVYICNPNNPTGAIMPAADMEKLINELPDHILIVADEVYHHFVSSPDFPDSLGYVLEGKNLFIVHSFSKAYGLAGLRLGAGISTPEVAEYLTRLRKPFHLGSLTMAAGIAALADQEYLQKSIEMVQTAKSYLYEQFARLGIHYWPSETNFILFRSPIPPSALAEKMNEYGILLRPLDQFWGMPEYARVTVGLPVANEAFITALETILSGNR
jgi:histidinol-phosphate aminotransferase